MLPLICGYMLAKTAESLVNAIRPEDRVPPRQGRFYQGVERMGWDELHALHYRKLLSDDDEMLWKRIYDSASDLSGVELVATAEEALRVIAIVGCVNSDFDLIACYSKRLANSRGVFEAEVDLEHLGFDVISWGEWSLIRAGVLETARMEAWLRRLNLHGLFPSEEFISEFIDEYQHFAALNQVEPVGATKVLGIETVSVFRAIHGRGL